MTLRGLAKADELLQLRCNTEMLYHFNEVSDKHSRLQMQRQDGICKKTNEKTSQSLDGVWDVSSGMTLANTAKAKLVAKDSV